MIGTMKTMQNNQQSCWAFVKKIIGFEVKMKKYLLLTACFLAFMYLAGCQSQDETNRLTIKKIEQLAQKGDKLSWEDFTPYEGKEVGSGLYIMLYGIDNKYKILIGGPSKNEKPMYVYLVKGDSNEEKNRIDIRFEDVRKFIKEPE